MTPLVVENEPPVTFLRRKMTGGRFSMGVVIRRYTGAMLLLFFVGFFFFFAFHFGKKIVPLHFSSPRYTTDA